MDQRERINDNEEGLRTAIEGALADLWTALPCIVQSFDRVKGTCTVQPTIQAKQRDRKGALQDVNLPLLLDVPVVFPGGGSLVVTFPVRAGDECLVVFASRCIDAWWQQAGVQPQAEQRMHSLSDGFAFIGPRSVPNVIANVSATTAQLRTLDGTAYIELTAAGAVNIKAPGGVNVTGTIVATDEITAKNVHTVSNHVHGGVQPGSGSTGLPTG